MLFKKATKPAYPAYPAYRTGRRTGRQKNNKTIKQLTFVFLFSCFFVFLSLVHVAQAQRAVNPVTVYFFRGEGCPHCAAEEIFLEDLRADFTNVTVRDFEIWYNADNAKLAQDVAEVLNVRSGGVPMTVIGDQVISGFLSAETTGVAIRRAVERYTASGDPDVAGSIIADSGQAPPAADKDWKTPLGQAGVVALPLLGNIDAQNMSLFALTGVFGILDGFNPCAMWVLVFLISMLLGVPSRTRQWAIGLVFILTSGAVYFLFMAAWLNIFLFIGFLLWIRLTIGGVAIASGIYQLREFFVNKNAACKVIDPDKRKSIGARIQDIIQQKSIWLAFVGVVSLAAAINMVELVCSAGLPAIYTSVLSAAGLATWQYYAYLLLYIFLYILDDLVVFSLAMATLKFAGVTTKYVRAANLVGGIIILLLGILLIFKPGWIMFG